jgi:hypothetical protein
MPIFNDGYVPGNNVNLEDHKDHDIAECSYARILFVQNLLASSPEGREFIVSQLSLNTLMRAGFMISMESPMYVEFEVSQVQAIEMSEVLRTELWSRCLGAPEHDDVRSIITKGTFADGSVDKRSNNNETLQ